MSIFVRPLRPNVVSIESAPRPTPTPPRVRFSDLLTRSAHDLVRGAELAMRTLSGAPLLAVAVRGGSAVPTVTAPSLAKPNVSAGGAAPEGPSAVAGTTVTRTSPEMGVEASLLQAQELNLYYLRVQEQVNAQHRLFTVLSNVLKAQHETVKTAIGNIR